MNPRLRVVVFVGVLSVLLLGLNGNWTDPWLLGYLGAWGAMALYAAATISDGLARERYAPPNAGADKLPLMLLRATALAALTLGALDSGRWHLFPVPATLRLVGFAGYIIFGALILRAMHVNRFFSAVVRIQDDRGHVVVDQGPYGVVRHPGYLGMITAIPFGGLVLGSWLSVGLALVCSAMVLRRVMFEDAFLHANLKGYADYLTRVPYRLVPGVW